MSALNVFILFTKVCSVVCSSLKRSVEDWANFKDQRRIWPFFLPVYFRIPWNMRSCYRSLVYFFFVVHISINDNFINLKQLNVNTLRQGPTDLFFCVDLGVT